MVNSTTESVNKKYAVLLLLYYLLHVFILYLFSRYLKVTYFYINDGIKSMLSIHSFKTISWEINQRDLNDPSFTKVQNTSLKLLRLLFDDMFFTTMLRTFDYLART